MSSFKPAVREALRLRMALEGPSGSGKTITALRIAQGLGARIAVIDTENRSASRYIGEDFGEGPLQFDVVELDSFEPRRLVKLLSEAADAGYDVVIVDSLSHFWMGEGGMLDSVDAAAKRTSGNSFAAWKAVKPAEREMWDALIRCRTHLICTLRTKTEWVIEENDRGKKTPRKIGLKAEQREGLEYEFDVVGDLSIDHDFIASKTRCSALDGKAFTRPGANVAAILRGWLGSGPVRDHAPRQRPAEDDRPQRRDDVDDRAQRDDREREPSAEVIEDVDRLVRAFQSVDPDWTEAAIAKQLGVSRLAGSPKAPALDLHARAKAGEVHPPKASPKPSRSDDDDDGAP